MPAAAPWLAGAIPAGRTGRIAQTVPAPAFLLSLQRFQPGDLLPPLLDARGGSLNRLAFEQLRKLAREPRRLFHEERLELPQPVHRAQARAAQHAERHAVVREQRVDGDRGERRR